MDNDLQFERAEAPRGDAMTCSGCGQSLVTEYYAVNGKIFCERCAASLREIVTGKGLGVSRFLKALLVGLGAAIVASAVYAAVMIITNYELALVTIAMGWLIGKAVRMGSQHRGGWRYQVLAALLTYTAICGAYGIQVLWGEEQLTAAEVVAVALIMFRIPFLAGIQNAIGLLIIGFGVWQAWQLNRPIAVEVTGPHAIGAGPQTGAAPLV